MKQGIGNNRIFFFLKRMILTASPTFFFSGNARKDGRKTFVPRFGLPWSSRSDSYMKSKRTKMVYVLYQPFGKCKGA